MKKRTFLIPLFAVFALAISPIAVADKSGDTHPAEFADHPWMHAIVHGDAAEIKRLLEDGDPNTIIEDAPILSVAAYNGQIEIVNVLLSAGANPNLTDNKGTALMQLSAGLYRISEAIDSDGGALFVSTILKSHPELAEEMRSEGIDLNAWTEKDTADLVLGMEKLYVQIAELLLSAGANPDARDKRDETALMKAAYKGHAEIAKVLLAAGANPNAKNKQGRTALVIAKTWGTPEIVRILEEAGAKE